MRVGLVGCGRIARVVHLPVLRRLRGARLTAVSDPDEQARAHASRAAGVETHATTADLLRRADLDAVVVCAPTPLHADLAEAVAGAGKHLYLEKPVATDLGGGKQAVDAVGRSGVLSAVGFNFRVHPLHQVARRLVAGGAVGRVRAVQTVFCEPAEQLPEWKRRRASGGGVLLDLGSHHIDTVRWLLGDEVEAAEGALESRASEDDTARVRLRMAGGVEVATYLALGATRADTIVVTGERGVLHLDRYGYWVELAVGMDPRGAWVRRRRRPSPALPAPWRLHKLIRPAHEPSYARALAAFVALVRGQRVDLASMQDGLRSLEVVCAVEEAARAGAAVGVAR